MSVSQLLCVCVCVNGIPVVVNVIVVVALDVGEGPECVGASSCTSLISSEVSRDAATVGDTAAVAAAMLQAKGTETLKKVSLLLVLLLLL